MGSYAVAIIQSVIQIAVGVITNEERYAHGIMEEVTERVIGTTASVNSYGGMLMPVALSARKITPAA